MYTAGIDLGSTAIKAVFVKDKKIVWHKAVPTAPGQEMIAKQLIADGITSLNISEADISGIAATGYGKKLLSTADKTIDEVSANNTALQEAISDELFTDVKVLELPQFSVAFGAAISLE